MIQMLAAVVSGNFFFFFAVLHVLWCLVYRSQTDKTMFENVRFSALEGFANIKVVVVTSK